jgi:GT2 family glycosyltransferase
MYYEDVDFCFRARKAGFKLGIADKAIIYHQIKRSKKGKKLMDYYLARNHLLFVKKHAPLFVKIRELIRLPKTLWEHYRNKEFGALIGIKDALLKKKITATFIFLSILNTLYCHFCCL